MSETTNSAGVADPVAPVTIYAATLDAGSVVVAVSISNLLAEGAFAIDADTYAAAWSKLGRCKLVSGALQDYVPPAPPAPRVTQVTRTQGLIQLHRASLLDAYNQAVAAADVETQIWAANAPVWSIDNANLQTLASALKLSGDQVQSLFDAGAQIV